MRAFLVRWNLLFLHMTLAIIDIGWVKNMIQRSEYMSFLLSQIAKAVMTVVDYGLDPWWWLMDIFLCWFSIFGGSLC